MTEQALKQSLTIVSTNYNKPLDENIMMLWKALFLNFNELYFKKACLKVIAANKFFPNASELIEAYQSVKYEIEQERLERLKENQRLLTVNQAYCYLCENSGYCFYRAANYEYVARCICSHGQDLNRFSQSQANCEHKPEAKESYTDREKGVIKNGGNPFYVLTIREALKDDFEIFDARKKEKYMARKTADVDADKKNKILKIMGCA